MRTILTQRLLLLAAMAAVLWLPAVPASGSSPALVLTQHNDNKDPVQTLRTNIQGSEVVPRLARRYRRKMLVASNSKVYGKSAAQPFREGADSVMGLAIKSRLSYAESKAHDEFLDRRITCNSAGR